MDWLFYLMLAASAIAGYLLGNISSGYIISMAISRKDVRKYGSHSAGTTNMIRMYGTGIGAATFVCDVLKGAIAAFAGVVLAGATGGMLAGLAAVAGHNWPALLKFRGGKGIATTAGMLLVLFPKETAVLLVAAIAVIAITRIVSIGSLAGVCMITLAVVFHTAFNIPNTTLNGMSDAVTIVTVPASIASLFPVFIYAGMGLIFAMAFFSHRENLKRLFTGTERRLKFRRSASVLKESRTKQADTENKQPETDETKQKKVLMQ